MKLNKSVFSTAMLLLGIVLVIGSAVLLLFSNLQKQAANDDTPKVIAAILEILPELRDEVPDDRINISMPIMEINQKSYCGIIEVPAYNTELPISAYWDKTTVHKQPCRYTGSIYDGSFIIGGSDNAGQFDFIQSITNGDTVYVTDMTGARYTYVVEKIKRTYDVSAENLISGEYDLTLFAKNTYSLDYTLVRCSFK